MFADAIARHRDALYRVCCGYVRNEADREDIFQEVLIHIWKSLDSFEGRSRLVTWMYRIAVNTCLGWLRSEGRRSQMLERAGAELQVARQATAREIPGAKAEEIELLYDRISRLAPVDRLLVSLYLEEMDSAGMAAVLGISEGNVRVKLHRIRNQLREMEKKENHELGRL